MNTRKLEETSRLVGATSWAAIASGVVVALAIQTVLVLLGLAVGLSVGDGMIAGGFAVWAVLVQLCSMAVGAALAAATSHAEGRMGGIIAGVMTWAVAITIGGLLSSIGIARLGEGGAWTAFFGAVLGLGAAILGGGFGSLIHGSSRGSYTTTDRGPITMGGPL